MWTPCSPAFFLVRPAAHVCSLCPRVSETDVVKSVASDDNEGAVAWDIPVVKALRGSGFLELLHRRVMVHAAGPAGS